MAPLVCRVVANPSEMAALAPAWQALADRALEANPFYEPSFLLPLIEETGPYRGLLFWVVAPRDAPGDLRGVFPFHRRRVGPMTLLSPFTRGRSGGQHIDIDLGVPLIDGDRADAVIDAVLSFLDRSYFWALDWFALTEDGAFHQQLLARLAARRQPNLPLGGWTRPLFRPCSDADVYLAETLSKRRRAQLGQYRRRLARDGEISFDLLGPDDDPGSWIETYFALEASGWKGRQGSDVGASEPMRRFFARTIRARHHAGGLFAYRLCVGGRTIAQTWILIPANGGVGMAWKMAYDDAYAKESPGLQMQVEAITLLHTGTAPISVFDSCAHTSHSMWQWLLRDRTVLACLMVVPRTLPHRLGLDLSAMLRRWRIARLSGKKGTNSAPAAGETDQ